MENSDDLKITFSTKNATQQEIILFQIGQLS